MTDILICSYLEPEHVARIRAASDDVRVHDHPDLLPAPRYRSDHTGGPFVRSPEQRERWYQLVSSADVCFDVDYADLSGFKEHATNARWIQASSAGIGQLVRRAGFDALPATFTTAAGVHARPLAEFVAWGMLAFAKSYPTARRQQRERRWVRFHTEELAGKTLAIVGLGSIGREVARTAALLGMRVVGTKRTTAGRSAEEHGVSALYAPERLHDMLGVADYVCLVAPHTAETEGMIDAAAFAAMKPGSVLINIGRGALVDESAMLAALEHGPLRGAVLDVATQEPLPSSHPLWDHENVIIYPHSASTSTLENERLTDLFIDNLQRFLAGRPLRNTFDVERMY